MKERNAAVRAVVTTDRVAGAPPCDCGDPECEMNQEHAGIRVESSAFVVATVSANEDGTPLLTVQADYWDGSEEDLQICIVGILNKIDSVGLLEPVLRNFHEARAAREIQRALEAGQFSLADVLFDVEMGDANHSKGN